MKRFFFPLVFLIAATGFLFGGSVGATYFGRPIIQNQENYTYYSANAGTDQHEPKSESFWVRTFSDPIAFYTLGLFLFTFVLAISTVGLWWQTRNLVIGAEKQGKDMAQAARAATRQADAAESILTDLETPFIYPVIQTTDFKQAFSMFVMYENTANDPAQPVISFTLKNYGRTAALLQSVAAVADHFTEMPEKPRVDFLAEYAVDYILPVGEETKKTFSKEVRIPIDLTAYKSIKGNQSRIFLYGEIKFTDVFGSSYIQSFCLASDYAVQGFIPWGAHYNKRERHNEAT